MIGGIDLNTSSIKGTKIIVTFNCKPENCIITLKDRDKKIIKTGKTFKINPRIILL